MSKRVMITTDSTADLDAALLERFDIHTIPLTITLDGETYLDGRDFTPDDLYRRYHENGSLPQTAAPGIEALGDFFRSFTAQGFEVVHLDISAELSGTYNAARLAAEELDGVYVVDTRALSCGVGLLALEAAECRERGMGAREIAAHVEALREKVSSTFLLDTLEFMWKGGRCAGVTAIGANLMKLRPALKLAGGKIVVFKKYRGKIEQVYRQYLREQLSGRAIRPGHIFFADSGEIGDETVAELTALVRAAVPGAQVHHVRAGCTVSSHCGPGTIGVFFIEE